MRIYIERHCQGSVRQILFDTKQKVKFDIKKWMEDNGVDPPTEDAKKQYLSFDLSGVNPKYLTGYPTANFSLLECFLSDCELSSPWESMDFYEVFDHVYILTTDDEVRKVWDSYSSVFPTNIALLAKVHALIEVA